MRSASPTARNDNMSWMSMLADSGSADAGKRGLECIPGPQTRLAVQMDGIFPLSTSGLVAHRSEDRDKKGSCTKDGRVRHFKRTGVYASKGRACTLQKDGRVREERTSEAQSCGKKAHRARKKHNRAGRQEGEQRSSGKRAHGTHLHPDKGCYFATAVKS